ncbi:MAG: crossover junction endodeoxyribonuclease RuvC [Candidatus Cloacimonetes bacterium]|nr:crossover junction endodeoxyribonuclease RuvC [Candidatus Cloacimonadota bacterium]
MIIIGVDPGSRKCGYGILHIERNKILAAGSGIINLEKKVLLEKKLLHLSNELKLIIDQYKPNYSVVESIFYGKNIQTAFILGHIRGVVMYCLSEKDIPVYSFSPREIKKSVTGNGNATKSQVEYMIQSILNLKTPAKEDAADGLACAMCLFNRIRSSEIGYLT